MMASQEGHTDIVQMLIAAGANLDERTSVEWYQGAFVRLSLCSPLIGCISVSCSCCLQKGYTALMFAAARGHLDIVRILLTAGANVNALDYVCLHSLPIPFPDI
jgi:ankyrin repeat protein